MSGDPVYWHPNIGWQPFPGYPSTCCAPQPVYGQAFTTVPAAPTPARLSDEDVERIAERVVELLKAGRVA